MFGDSNPISTVAAAGNESSGSTGTIAVWAVVLIVIGGCCCLCLCFVALCVCCDSTRSMDSQVVSTQHQLGVNSSSNIPSSAPTATADGKEAGVEMTGGHALPTWEETVGGQDTN